MAVFIFCQIFKFQHEQWNNALSGFDIALLKIEKVQFTDAIQPACLPFKQILPKYPEIGMPIVAAGWG